MKLIIRAGSLLRSGPERDLVDDYVKRANGLVSRCGFLPLAEQEIDLKKCRDRSDETQKILTGITSSSKLVVLDERGKSPSSRDIAQKLRGAQSDGADGFILAIGGADGFDPSELPSGVEKWSFGRQTWPHKLVRVMAAEQMYRALSILAGTPYHRD